MKKKILNVMKFVFYGKTAHYRKKDYILVPLYAVIFAVVIRSLFFDHFHVPSGSMENTLLVGDKIIISKMSYGYSRYSFPFGLIPFSGRIFVKNEPVRGDIIVFKLPSDKSTNYVKRLIGLPDDKIKLIDGVVYINGNKVEKIKEDVSATYTTFMETLPNGFKYLVLEQDGIYQADNIPEFIVPKDHYFFMGDNRDRSQDSRFFTVGFVHRDLILGKVNRIIISSPYSLLNVFKWNTIRTDRIWKSPYLESNLKVNNTLHQNTDKANG